MLLKSHWVLIYLCFYLHPEKQHCRYDGLWAENCLFTRDYQGVRKPELELQSFLGKERQYFFKEQ